MSGIRDMSTIEEPPFERQPGGTFVLEYNEVILAEAIKKELARGGQVYYLHNRVDNIESTAARVQRMAPGARVGIAHGKMTEEELNPDWQKLLNGELDVLVLHHPDRGRASTCATATPSSSRTPTGWAWPSCTSCVAVWAAAAARLRLLHFPPGQDPVRHRAEAAVRHPGVHRLRLRLPHRHAGPADPGAGNLLGHSQHGHMEAVGYDLYMKMLNQAIAAAPGRAVQRDKSECPGDLRVDAYIPERYIPDGPGRIEAYRRIAAIQNPPTPPTSWTN